MNFSVEIQGLDALAGATAQIREAVASEIQKGLYASAKQVEGEAKKSILSGSKSGRIYTRRSVTHRASAPGEAPASDTGRLVNSINSQLSGPSEATVKAGAGIAQYAPWLEFGTSKIAPRPFMFPALEKSKQWIYDRMQDALRRGINRGK
jgi:HK97 gp10 family phage protein